MHFKPSLQGDREIVLAAVKQKERCATSFKLQGDREMAMAAIKQDGIALFASIELRGDREIVMAAVRRTASAATWSCRATGRS